MKSPQNNANYIKKHGDGNLKSVNTYKNKGHKIRKHLPVPHAASRNQCLLTAT